MTETLDVLIIGGGPAGSTCARNLTRAGLNVLVIDKKTFPRDKTCAGWITPQVIQTLQLDVEEYARGRVFQPITAFQVGVLGRPGVRVDFRQPVSYGIRRFEFDEYLLNRAETSTRLGETVKSIERTDSGWLINGEISARMLVGAGGHFCPVARILREKTQGHVPLVTAVEAEFPIGALSEQVETDGHVPRLYFCPDLGGYGWCVRKQDHLNIGIGLVDSRETSASLPGLLESLRQEHAFTGEVPSRFHGHAYLLHAGGQPQLVDDGVVLIGDAAGLAYPQSGEGIRPAVESGVLAARTILAAAGDYSTSNLSGYQQQIEERFGKRVPSPSPDGKPQSTSDWKAAAGRLLLRSKWFVRNVVVLRWFLHAQQPALAPE